ncbi:hypothetical protein [Paenibacillus bovis]|uniref:Uncharacterized protein n=1 Tax=Paenibacillus bovis TaxID=1616788 RepID=A0A1X9T429_9BACL|nr:hypothetical protein [Paenibacillus bovis]ARR10717.1 hypothetical protein AR543_p0109 [Paenibacillus bovis]
MEENKISDIWYWTEKAERKSYCSQIKAGEPAWALFQNQMPNQWIVEGLVVQVRCCGDQVIWNMDEWINPQPKESIT